MPLSFEVPRLALGAAPIGSMPAEFLMTVTEEQARNTIRHAISLGVTMIDTAPFYGNGRSEVRIGSALSEVERSKIILCTKVGWIPNAVGGDPTNGKRDYSRDGVMRSIEGSLKRLKTSYLDIVHVHDPDLGDFAKVVRDETFPTLNALKSDGVIRAIGCGMSNWSFIADYIREGLGLDCCLLAGRYTLLEQEPAKVFFPLCQKHGVSIFLAGVYNSGILATGGIPGARYNYAPAPEPILRLARIIEKTCRDHGVSLRAAAMQFSGAHPAVKSLIMGVTSPEELSENQANLEISIPKAFWEDLLSRGLIDESLPYSTTGQS